jgi:histidinol dehydrogenase
VSPEARTIRVLRWGELDLEKRERFLRRNAPMPESEFVDGVRRVVEDVRERGDEAVADALKRFDGCEVSPQGLAAAPDEFAAARRKLPEALVKAIRESIARVRQFNERVIAERSWMIELRPGLEVGEKLTPISSAGLFVPSGKGSYPSSLFQIATPAIVAGVPEVAIVVPPIPGSDGEIDPAVLAVAEELGIEKVFRVNGPAGIAALAFGTESIPQTVKVLGPGSPPVQIAQFEIQRYGTATVMTLGPTESMIIADSSADPVLLAADLLSEAEHGSDSAAVLVTAEEDMLAAVEREVAGQLKLLPEPRQGFARAAIGQVGGAVLVESLAQAAEFASQYAPEHLQIATSDPEVIAEGVQHAGEILLGQGTPFSAANYTIGIPAALPTSRFARVSSGVTAETFVKRVSMARLSEAAIDEIGPAVVELAKWEGFPAHSAAVEIRMNGRGAVEQSAARSGGQSAGDRG